MDEVGREGAALARLLHRLPLGGSADHHQPLQRRVHVLLHLCRCEPIYGIIYWEKLPLVSDNHHAAVAPR